MDKDGKSRRRSGVKEWFRHAMLPWRQRESSRKLVSRREGSEDRLAQVM